MDLYIIKEHIADAKEQINKMLEAEQYFMNTKEDDKINHDFFALQINEKVDYLLGKDPTIRCENQAYIDAFLNCFDKDFLGQMQEIATDASIKGITWLQAYINLQGELKFMCIPAEEIIPVWTDKTHKKLDKVIRYYPIEKYEGTYKKVIWKLEIYDDKYCYFYEEVDGQIRIDAEKYFNIGDGQEHSHFYLNGVGYGMGRPPFIPIKNNLREKSDLDSIKDLIDAYNDNRTREDETLEDFKNFLVNVRNYSGDEANAKSLKQMLENRMIFTDGDGGVEILTPKIDSTANSSHNQTLKDDIILFGQSVDRNKQINGAAASGVALKALYAGLDLKCNQLERQINKAIDELEYYLKSYLRLLGHSVSDVDNIALVFNRDISINETEAVEMCKNSIGVISKETVVANHPFVTDLDKELKRIADEDKASFDYAKQVMSNEE